MTTATYITYEAHDNDRISWRTCAS